MVGMMKHVCIRLACCAFVCLFSLAAAGREEIRIEPIAEMNYPCLVFVQEDIAADPAHRSSLMVASFLESKPVIQKVLTAQYIEAMQLSDAVFLLQASQHPKDHT
jgi:hypothetical protein